MNNYKQYLIILLSLVICSVSFGQYFSMRIDSMTTVLEYECYVANWYYDSQLMETNNIAVIEDTIFQISYDDIETGFSDTTFSIITPINPTVGTQWVGMLGGVANVIVSDFLDIEVPAGIFPSFIYDFFSVEDSLNQGQIAYSDNIGLVKFYQIHDGIEYSFELDSVIILGGNGVLPLEVGNEWNLVPPFLSIISENQLTTPNNFQLYEPFPNPFNPTTSISFSIPEQSQTSLKVYDIKGKLISTLLNESMNVGHHQIEWNADGYPSGVYFVQLDAVEFTQTQKLMLVK